MPGLADRQTQRALLEEQWDSLDDLTQRLGQRVRERPSRDAEEGPGHLPDPNVAQELILTRGRLASVEKERDRLQRRLEVNREKIRRLRTDLRRERRHLEKLSPHLDEPAAAAPDPEAPPAAAAPVPAPPPLLAVVEVVEDEPEADFQGAPLPDSAPETESPEPPAAAVEQAELEADRLVHWSARALLDRISAGWRNRDPR
jgi:hypothetical protein